MYSFDDLKVGFESEYLISDFLENRYDFLRSFSILKLLKLYYIYIALSTVRRIVSIFQGHEFKSRTKFLNILSDHKPKLEKQENDFEAS